MKKWLLDHYLETLTQVEIQLNYELKSTERR